jgi:hypothetical protein
MEILTTENVQQFSFGFKLLLEFDDPRVDQSTPINNPATDTWTVEIVTPDGTQLTKTTDLEFPDDTLPQIAVPILTGELNRKGEYRYQPIKTTASKRIKFEVRSFEVNASLPTI